MSALREALRAEARRLAGALGAGFAVGAASVGLAATSGWLIVRAAQRPVLLTLSVPIGLVQLFALARASGRYLERTATHGAVLRVMARVRSRLARELEPLVPAGLGPRSADVVDRAVRDAERVEESLSGLVAPLVAGALVAVATAGLLGLVAPVATVALGAGLVALALLGAIGAARAGRAEGRDDEVRERLRALVDGVVRDPAASALGEGVAAVGARVAALDDALDGARRAGARWRGVLEASGALVAGLVVVAVVLGEAHGHVRGPRAAVAPLASLAALDLLAGLGGLAAWRGDARARGRLAHLDGTVPVRPPVDERRAAGAHVVAEDLAIAYDAPLVAGVSLELAPGERVLVRGPSGSGKTSLAWVLAKLRDPSGGRVALEGVDFVRLAAETVRDSVLFVEDAPYVFAGSLADNLRIANPAASDEELRAALAFVGLEALAARPGGLDAPLRGAEIALSGGERVRLGLARARLRDRPVLVLDEPTEGLDGASAQRLVASLASQGTALLVIAHRPEVAALATRVVELSGPGHGEQGVAQARDLTTPEAGTR